jgi:hypothetical protein
MRPHPDTHTHAARLLDAADACLRLGHALEAAGRLADAIAAYERSGSFATDANAGASNAARRARALAAMNRANALQRFGDDASLAASVCTYDDAIAIFHTLPLENDSTLCNQCGAAWLNRGRALQLRRDTSHLAAAISSHERAIALLCTLPENGPACYARNLAGAWLNLADALLGTTTPDSDTRARAAARTAIRDATSREETDPEFADLGLKARRALVEALGRLLVTARDDPFACDALAAEASDAIDDGLALARRWETRGHRFLRPVAARLFRFGAQLYRIHQPHFLAEFVLENLAPTAIADDTDFQAIARDSLAAARAELDRPRLLHIGDRESERIADLARELAAAERQLAAAVVTSAARGRASTPHPAPQLPTHPVST